MPRVASGIVMLAAGGFAVWAGGILFAVLIAACCGGMIWELARMLQPGNRAVPLQLGILSAGAVLAAALLPVQFVLPMLAAPALVGFSQIGPQRRYWLSFALWVLLAGFGFIWLRNHLGMSWMIWLFGVVVATDVAGYFAGKTLGGPKFWPRVSPKKTWSGTSAGWAAAAVVGAVFAVSSNAGFALVPFSVLISMASQGGDIAESALKRKMGVKDSSALIPGHGGLFDRFDGMLGASAMIIILMLMGALPNGVA
jgi:phosphatidate cytidylyltransferase